MCLLHPLTAAFIVLLLMSVLTLSAPAVLADNSSQPSRFLTAQPYFSPLNFGSPKLLLSPLHQISIFFYIYSKMKERHYIICILISISVPRIVCTKLKNVLCIINIHVWHSNNHSLTVTCRIPTPITHVSAIRMLFVREITVILAAAIATKNRLLTSPSFL